MYRHVPQRQAILSWLHAPMLVPALRRMLPHKHGRVRAKKSASPVPSRWDDDGLGHGRRDGGVSPEVRHPDDVAAGPSPSECSDRFSGLGGRRWRNTALGAPAAARLGRKAWHRPRPCIIPVSVALHTDCTLTLLLVWLRRLLLMSRNACAGLLLSRFPLQWIARSSAKV